MQERSAKSNIKTVSRWSFLYFLATILGAALAMAIADYLGFDLFPLVLVIFILPASFAGAKFVKLTGRSPDQLEYRGLYLGVLLHTLLPGVVVSGLLVLRFLMMTEQPAAHQTGNGLVASQTPAANSAALSPQSSESLPSEGVITSGEILTLGFIMLAMLMTLLMNVLAIIACIRAGVGNQLKKNRLQGLTTLEGTT